MNGQDQSSFSRSLRPYLSISLAGILAFFPVSFMLYSLKNDIVALEYPINYYISQCIHNAEAPYWFNTWGLGFPLQSNLTWGIYSTPQVLFGTVFNYNIYVLHIEFMFFILLSGWGMFYLLKRHLIKDEHFAQVLAVCYMLSGFMVGSSQWLLYITAAAFVPFVIAALLDLFRAPSLRHSLRFAIVYVMMFTSAYAAFNIITSYSLLVFSVIYFFQIRKTGNEKARIILFSLLAVVLTLLFCFPCLYYTVETLRYMSRGGSIAGTAFFNSNYVHPASLLDMLLPFSSVRMKFANTEGTMFNAYAGLLPLLLLPATVLLAIKKKNTPVIILLLAAIFFLLLSFGAMTPLRDAANVLPGFSYFRNPGIFRFYFILALILSTGMVFHSITWEDILSSYKNNRVIILTFFILVLLCVGVLVANSKSPGSLSAPGFHEWLRRINLKQALLISSAIQLFFFVMLALLVVKRRYRTAKLFLLGDLVLNTLICTPYFTVSSYSLVEVNKVLASTNGFPPQSERPAEVPATITDNKKNTWYNTNIYKKKISTNYTYRGPLTLAEYSSYIHDTSIANTVLVRHLVFQEPDSSDGKNKVRFVLQRPTHIRVSTELVEETKVTALQNYFPGWKAYYNDRPVSLIDKDKPGLTVAVPKGVGTIDFVYEKKAVLYSALLLHLIITCFLIGWLYKFVKRFFVRSSYPSSQD